MAATQTDFLRKAGSKFGIDLRGLFEDEEGNEVDTGGLVPGFKITSQLKGRSPNTATYKAPSEPARTAEFTLTTPSEYTPTQPGPAAYKPEAEELKKYFGEVGGVGVTDIGQQGFGMKDYNAAIDAGYDPESIREWVMSNQANLYNIGPDAQKKLGITGYVSTKPGVFDYGAAGGAGFGMEDYNALVTQGVTPDKIRTLAKQAPTLGTEAAKQLGISASQTQQAEAARQQVASMPAPSYTRPTGAGTTPVTGYGLGTGTGSGFNYAAFGGSGFGLQDVAALQSKGASQEDMRRIAQGASNIGPGARALLGL
jgi:hypothetical protein